MESAGCTQERRNKKLIEFNQINNNIFKKLQEAPVTVFINSFIKTVTAASRFSQQNETI